MPLKVYNLGCEKDHTFEGWFGSQEDFDAQLARGLIACPLCESADIRRLPNAARLNLGVNAKPADAAAAAAADAAAQPKQQAMMPTHAQMQTLLAKMAREIAANTEDVGDRFADEARRIHYKEAPERGIRGVTTREEAAALEEEGINVVPMPFGSLLKDPLQ
jgi:hypothetical protein